MSASSLRDLAFRFFFAFFGLYNFPFPLNAIPGVPADEWTNAGWDVLVAPVGRMLFGATPSPAFTGSGDTRWNWTQLVIVTALSLIATIVWTIVARGPVSDRLRSGFHTYIRFALGYTMLSYGTAKVVPTQFLPPSLDRLVQPFGDASPMGILWTFMGASLAYVIFTGLGEMLGGLLLMMRRTALIGALVTAGVMTQVAALNFFYDVPVKIFSLFLLAEALFLIAYDAGRLRSLIRDVPRVAWWKIAIRTAAVIAVCVLMFKDGLEYRETLKARSPLRGVWRVDELQINGATRPPLITDLTRWRRLIFDFPQGMSIQLMSDRRNRYGIDLKPDQFSLKKRDAPDFRALLNYQRPDPNTLIVDGTFDGERIHAVTHREPENEFMLTTRGFHWINEFPFNR